MAANRSVSSTRRVVRLDRALRRFVTCSTRAWRVSKQAVERAAPPRHRTISVQCRDRAFELLVSSRTAAFWLYGPCYARSSASRVRRLGRVDASPRLPRARGRALYPQREELTSGRVKQSDNRNVSKPPAKAQTLCEASSHLSSVDLDRRASLDLLLHHSLRYAAATAACKGREASQEASAYSIDGRLGPLWHVRTGHPPPPELTLALTTEYQRSCHKQISQYTCPKCNLPYCSLACFRSPEHQACTETFDRTTLAEDLQGDVKDDESTETDKRQMLEMLKNFEDQQRELEEIRAQEGGPAGEEEEEDGPEAEARKREREELEKRLADVDLGAYPVMRWLLRTDLIVPSERLSVDVATTHRFSPSRANPVSPLSGTATSFHRSAPRSNKSL